MPVHVYDVAAGVQLAVKVDDPPKLIVPGEGVNVHVGGKFTVTVADAEVLSPTALCPTTEYVAVEVGETLPLEADVAKPVPVHVYDVAAGVQLAVKVEDPPRLMVPGDEVKVHVGGWFTVTVADAEVLSPAALCPTTE